MHVACSEALPDPVMVLLSIDSIDTTIRNKQNKNAFDIVDEKEIDREYRQRMKGIKQQILMKRMCDVWFFKLRYKVKIKIFF